MSRYNAGNVKISEEVKLQMGEDIHPKPFAEIKGICSDYEYSVTYGFDHACGYFIQFEKVTIDDFEEEELIDIDSMFYGLFGSDLGYILNKLFPNNSIIMTHGSMAYLDLEF